MVHGAGHHCLRGRVRALAVAGMDLGYPGGKVPVAATVWREFRGIICENGAVIIAIMKSLRSQTVSDQLRNCGTVVFNANRVAEIRALLLPKGYSEAELNAGALLHAAAVQAVTDQSEFDGNLLAASEAMKEAELVVREGYQDCAKVARKLFRRDAASRELLGLAAPMPRRQAAFEVAARKLFNSAGYSAVVRTKLLKKGYDEGRVSQERGKISAWVAARQVFTEMEGASEGATSEAANALVALVDWTVEYITTARVTLKKRPDLLQKLGLLVRNEKTERQRNAPQKAAATRAAKKALRKVA